MNNKHRFTLIVGIGLLVASPFLGLLIAPLLHPVTCQPTVPGRLQLFNCLAGDFWTWVVTLIFMVLIGAIAIRYATQKKQPGRKNTSGVA